MRWAGHVGRMEERRSAYSILVGKREGNSPLGRPRHRWEDNIKMDLQEVGWGAWTGLIWLRMVLVAGTSSSIERGEFLD